MSVTSQLYKVQYVLTAATQTLAVPFYFIDGSHLRVIRNREGAADLPLTVGTHYTVSGAGASSGGSITLTGVAVAIGDAITVKRYAPLTQATRYLENDKFRAPTHELALDKLTMLVQQAHEKADRGLGYSEGEVIGSGNVLPEVVTRRNRLLAFDSVGHVDVGISADDVRTLVVANPVAALSGVTDYGSVGDPVTDVADYGLIS